MEGMLLQQLIIAWWKQKASPKLQEVYRAIPTIILWTIWKRRNVIKHGSNIRYEEMVNQVVGVVRQLIKAKYPWIERIEWSWPDISSRMGIYKPKLHYLSVIWKPPVIMRIKCNTDGANRGNSGLSSFGYCLRDSRGDLLFAKSRGIGIATNMEPECLAILNALITCKERKLQDVLIETDSLSLKKTIQWKWKVPWELVERIRKSETSCF
ncbi:hypothetical protein MTR67_001576 [Solanum verrucosum]|uniref:RNase H type-1 domain-containing protein n=1 Tax=Solanum verrucosum TaxID=315347 RepID=A0AAF0PPA3_SOLVR|nr:hypothetical protein MTR67_001576 [Solanum verrucosum]